MTDMIDDSLNSSGLSKGNVLVDCALELGAKWVEQVIKATKESLHVGKGCLVKNCSTFISCWDAKALASGDPLVVEQGCGMKRKLRDFPYEVPVTRHD
ncbi:hypothetical protein AXG93_2265s1150 [Marchantia polymorpha subsp. ruderalis]|uniref:Uncharacterized protein n=1 Tax=Marchantia polymorpha subsp. ruderalis TaxID=1480154 RepID=A0A176WF46_MARPO|nr:hypothetical protein AXG93_2265s1150 [Marchantia polymorpha subsp. ruderalis]